MISEMAFHTCDEIQAFKEAFDAFDWNKSGTISYKSLQVRYCWLWWVNGGIVSYKSWKWRFLIKHAMISLSLYQSLSLQCLFGAGGDDADDKRKESNNSGSMGSHCTAMLQLRWWINIKIMIITIDIIIVITLITKMHCFVSQKAWTLNSS